MSKLQKMKHEILIHVINSAHNSGEYTVSSTLYYNGFEKDGEPYKGKLKEVTCSECLMVINFIKNLK